MVFKKDLSLCFNIHIKTAAMHDVWIYHIIVSLVSLVSVTYQAQNHNHNASLGFTIMLDILSLDPELEWGEKYTKLLYTGEKGRHLLQYEILC